MVTTAAFVGCAVTLLAACNAIFGIEEQPTRDEAVDAGLVEDADAGPSMATRCTHDSDCIAPNACYTPHCDTVIGACTFALCESKGRTCVSGTCDPKTFACSDPQPYGFLATSYLVPGITSGCGPNARGCVAAAFPFLFIGTRDDVVALRVDDFLGKTAVNVTVTDMSARPQQVLASGRRIWVMGPVQGVAPPYQIAIAALDVPSDPTIASLRGRTSVISYPYPTAQAFPAPNDGLFVVYPDLATGFPTVQLPTLPPEGAVITAGALGDAGADAGANGPLAMHGVSGAPAGSSVVASSGSRLVLYRQGGTAVFDLISSPGTVNAKTNADSAIAPPILPFGPTSFAQGPEGTVTMSGPVAVVDADCNCSSKARLQWIYPNAAATATDPSVFLDPATYVNPATPAMCHVCPAGYFTPTTIATWLDHRSVLTAQPSFSAAGRTVTDVRYLGRDPLDGNAKRLFTTKATDKPHADFASDRIALTSSSGLGYFVVADDEGNDVTLSVVDPRCDAK